MCFAARAHSLNKQSYGSNDCHDFVSCASGVKGTKRSRTLQRPRLQKWEARGLSWVWDDTTSIRHMANYHWIASLKEKQLFYFRIKVLTLSIVLAECFLYEIFHPYFLQWNVKCLITNKGKENIPCWDVTHKVTMCSVGAPCWHSGAWTKVSICSFSVREWSEVCLLRAYCNVFQTRTLQKTYTKLDVAL